MVAFPFRHHRTCLALTEALRRVAAEGKGPGKQRAVAKGHILWGPSDTPDRMYVVDRGRMKIQAVDERGHELLLQVVNAGEPFGELCFCAPDQGQRGSTAIAVRDVVVTEWRYQDVLTHVRKHEDLLHALLVALCLRLTESQLRIEALGYRESCRTTMPPVEVCAEIRRIFCTLHKGSEPSKIATSIRVTATTSRASLSPVASATTLHPECGARSAVIDSRTSRWRPASNSRRVGMSSLQAYSPTCTQLVRTRTWQTVATQPVLRVTTREQDGHAPCHQQNLTG